MIKASSSGDSLVVAFENGRIESVADVPVEKGGAGRGFGPHELIEAALASCITITVRKVADESGFSLTAASCEVRADRSVPGRVTLGYTLMLEGPLTGEQDARLRQAAARCPVAKTLAGSFVVEEVT